MGLDLIFRLAPPERCEGNIKIAFSSGSEAA